MLHFKKPTLDYYRNVLNNSDLPGYGVQKIYDTISDINFGNINNAPEVEFINDDQITMLLHDLMPDIIRWFEKECDDPESAFFVEALEMMNFLITDEGMRALIPFFVDTIEKKKTSIIKQLLYAVKAAAKSQNKKYMSEEILKILGKYRIDWHELKIISQKRPK